MNSDIISCRYLSAVTPLGFVSRLGTLCDPEKFEHIYLLKGGTSSLRSQLIGDTAISAKSLRKEATLVPSALEKGRLEAVFWDKTAVIDADPPYGIEPRLPTAFEEVVWLGDCCGKGLRQKLPELLALDRDEREAFEQARKFLFAADELIKDNRRAALCCSDTEKAERQALKAAKKYLSPSDGGIISCVSHAAFDSRKIDLPPDFSLVLLQDTHGGCAQLYLKTLLDEARRINSGVTAAYSPLAPYGMIDILLVHGAGVCFAVESEEFTFSRSADCVINARRFTDKQKLARISGHLRQNRKAARQLYCRASLYFERFCRIRQKKEEIYNSFLETAKFDKLRQAFFANIFQNSSIYQL